MRKFKQLIKSMIIVIFLSLIIIFLCEGEQFGNIRGFFVQKLRFLSGKRESVENIFIGIFCSSVVTLIGYIFEYFQSLKNLQKDVELCYMHVRYELFPYINENNAEVIYKIVKDDIMIDMREIVHDYRIILDFYLGFLNLVNKLDKDDNYKIELLDFKFCSKYVKAAFVINTLYNHFILLNRNLQCKRICFSGYKEKYNYLKNIIGKKDFEKELDPWKQQYKVYFQSEKRLKQYIESLRLNEKCKKLDVLFGFYVLE